MAKGPRPGLIWVLGVLFLLYGPVAFVIWVLMLGLPGLGQIPSGLLGKVVFPIVAVLFPILGLGLLRGWSWAHRVALVATFATLALGAVNLIQSAGAGDTAGIVRYLIRVVVDTAVLYALNRPAVREYCGN